jgi:hypothetical protein
MTALASRFTISGDVRCFAGEALTVELAFDTAGSLVDLTGREWAWTVYRANDREPLFSAAGEIVSVGDDHFVRFAIDGDTTDELFARNRIGLRHEMAEVTASGREVWVEGQFSIARSAAAVSPAPVSATAGGVTRYVFDYQTRRVTISPRGAPGMPIWQALGLTQAEYDASVRQPAVDAAEDVAALTIELGEAFAQQQAQVDETLAGAQVNGGGLVTGGGAVGDKPTLTVTASTSAQAIAGTGDDTAMTPKATADLLAVAIPLYATRALVVAIAGGVPASVAQFRTAGYATVGDRGGASFRRVAAEPAHPGKLRDAVGAWFEQIDFVARPEQFGGFPSSNDCTVQVQAAWDYAAAKVMGGDVEFGPFTYKVGNVQARSGVKAFGAGMLRTKLERPTVGASGPYALVNGIVALEPAASRVSIHDLCMDSLSSTEAQPLLRLRNPRSDIDIQRVKFANAPARWAVRMDQSMDGRAQGEVPTYSNVSITQCRWDNCPAGGILFLPAAKGNQGVKINDNWFDRCGTNIIAIYDFALAGEVKGWDTNFDVTVDRNRVTNCLPTGNNGPIPVELWGCTRYSASDNFIDSGTRGISADGGSSDGVLARNIILNQTQYAYEAGNSRRVTIRDGVAYNCASLIQWTNNVEVRDFTVENMRLIGTGRAVYAPDSGPDALKVDGGNFYNLVMRNVKVIDPVFMRHGFYIKPNAGSSVLLEDCEVISRAANSSLRHFSVSGSGDVVVRRSRSRILMDLSATHYQSGNANQFATPIYSTAGQGSCQIEDHFFEMSGALNDFAGLTAMGAIVAAQPMYNVSISGVRIKGAYPSAAIFLPDTSGTSQVLGVDTTAMTAGTPAALNAAIMRRRLATVTEGTAPPTTGLSRTGDEVRNSQPTAGAPICWQCVAGGTPGVWVARYAAGSDPVLTVAYTPLSTYTTSPSLKVMGTGGSVLKVRCDALDVNGGQSPVTLIVEWEGRKGQEARFGQVRLAWANFSVGQTAPKSKSISHDDIAANAATVSSALDSSGRMETTITFPVEGGVGLRAEGIARLTSIYAAYSALLS